MEYGLNNVTLTIETAVLWLIITILCRRRNSSRKRWTVVIRVMDDYIVVDKDEKVLNSGIRHPLRNLSNYDSYVIINKRTRVTHNLWKQKMIY